ncbi:DEAD/DEAH box helicase [Streptomyces platensis]|uniref:DEAD/DEAH box helicase n=1 Tax=Streptomyces platensis TaxID=58346 RepID=UPI002E26821E|nr:DEAD/DEAH box helicase [Streptomyces platensis]
MRSRAPVSSSARKIAALIAAAPAGLDRAGVAAAAARRYPRMHEARLAALLAEAVEGGLLTRSGDRYAAAVPVAADTSISGAAADSTAPPTAATPVPRSGVPARPRPAVATRGADAGGREAVGAPEGARPQRELLRAVALDIESVVRTTEKSPYLERHPYEIAAIRFGTDQEWVAGAAEPFQRYLTLPSPQDVAELRSDAVREAVLSRGVDPAEALLALRGYLAGAEVVIAYNGTALDFPLLAQKAAAVGVDDPLDGTRTADALYLAHAMWPTANSHRLHTLATDLRVPTADLPAHRADSDAALLIRLLQHAAADLAERRELGLLIADVCHDSDAWHILRKLAGPGAPGGLSHDPAVRRTWAPAEVARLLGAGLAHHPPRRTEAGPGPGRGAVVVPGSLRGDDGRVDPAALARAVHGSEAEPRPAQQEMARTLHDWTERGLSGLLEAPTGTGKSYAVLAAALEWLAGGPGRTAVIATNTKQLQSQLARDLKNLERALPGVLGVTDLVKGRSNRLSLATLTRTLADATRDRGHRSPGRGPGRWVQYQRFRELAVYLALRLLAATEPPDTWTARSVDPVDLPPFLRDYTCPTRFGLWLEALSQRDGDYAPGTAGPLTAHTDTVREALEGHRLVLANHALAVAHADHLGAHSQETLLVLDEAHELENAATSALTVSVDYQDLEALLADYQEWTAGAADSAERNRTEAAVADLERLLDDERLPRLAAQAFDAQAKGVGVRIGGRATALAGPHTGTSGARVTRHLCLQLRRIGRAATACRIGLDRYAAQHGSRLDALVHERLLALAEHTDTVTTALEQITADLDAFLDPAPTFDGEPPSRVVFAEELGALTGELRTYRFRIAASPVELPASAEWRGFLASFPRVHYVSATLRVAGAWDFLRDRLGLAADLPALALASPFDLRRQTELVCFSDFPSWAEQEEGALRTVAHQLAGYAQEMTHARDDGRGYDGGGMVLTTARATAAGIGAHLVRELRIRGGDAPVVEAMTLGNGTAFQTFTDREQGGGFLVGTKGLWQGVDVSDEHRLRLVWINKLPFAPFAAPVVEARRAAVRHRAAEAGHPDPDGVATERYYLPLAALQLRQAVGRLIRSDRHRGVIVISDRKLAGPGLLRRSYRRAFLGSLDEGLTRTDPETGDVGGDNVCTADEGWRRIWRFLARTGLLDSARADELCTAGALARHTLLPHTRMIRELALDTTAVEQLRAEGRLVEEVLARAARIGGLLRLSDEPTALRPAQQAVIAAAVEGRNVLGLLPTGFGKSYTFQLPALVLPGVTLVVSPLVALMHDQALELNRTIGGAVRALISPLRESSSRTGKTEVADQLTGRHDHGIRIVYVSPERLSQRRFRELVREAVRTGRVTRIAIDEAHTLAQWEDFRPSMRRLGRFLDELRRDHGLTVTAVTATANRTVHESLRAQLFGTTAPVPRAQSPEDLAERTREPACTSLVTVRENPIRPELALHRRSLGQLGPAGVTGLVERVVDAVDGHAILYCLTVKEVNSLYTHLQEYAGTGRTRVLRFHSRLTEAEKSATTTVFREAPRQGEEGFAPVVIVATSAFGLGVNRPDVRTVFCVSPPTDLAALYQQVGRAGRDRAGRDLDDDAVNLGLTLATSRGLRMVRFMTGQDLPPQLLRRMGRLVLQQRDGTLDPVRLADRLMTEDLASGDLTETDLADRHVQDRYRTGVMRAFSALADLGAVTDSGDHPPYCAVKAGEMGGVQERAAPSACTGRGPDHADTDTDTEAARVEGLVVAQALAWDTPGKIDVRFLDRALEAGVPGYRTYVKGPAATWELLADLHDRGHLDVSAAPSKRFVTGLGIHLDELPAGYLPLLMRRNTRAGEELHRLKAYFESPDVCAQHVMADYFGSDEPPQSCCSTAGSRCSACWDAGRAPESERRPEVARAFHSPRPRDGGAHVDSAQRAQRVDRQVHRLLQLQPRGMHPRRVWHALRGDESAFLPGVGRMVALPRALRDSRHFGGRADLGFPEVGRSLARLAQLGAAQELPDGTWQPLRPVGATAEARRNGA